MSSASTPIECLDSPLKIGRVFRHVPRGSRIECPICGLRIVEVQEISPDDRTYTHRPGETLFYVAADLISHPGIRDRSYFTLSTRDRIRFSNHGEVIVFEEPAAGEQLRMF